MLARLVGGGGDHSARGGIAATADHHRPARQFRIAQNLDRGDELVEVDVKDPLVDAGRAHADNRRTLATGAGPDSG
ncbi:hypothetical protein RBB84_03660 [Rhodococcus sp. D-6]|uniref:Uncharacterized protein n=1 Tax=Rhodococcus sp. D-6 TaxID=1387842 RepID=A0AAU7UYJ9_9NOCA|nr:hypothetical protein [Rhodococcus sp. HS-D2]APE08458.1 hypothetical protein BO226_03845 [Rhodococcus sp. 2G]KHJ70228.1 hypothetical protein QR64_25030 [Rhodococcus sp. Chr-9]